jgi:hypothetical protein
MSSRRYFADGIRGSAQRRDPRPLGGLQAMAEVASIENVTAMRTLGNYG